MRSAEVTVEGVVAHQVGLEQPGPVAGRSEDSADVLAGAGPGDRARRARPGRYWYGLHRRHITGRVVNFNPRTTDQGGRGLFLVAQLARRWGTRYAVARTPLTMIATVVARTATLGDA